MLTLGQEKREKGTEPKVTHLDTHGLRTLSPGYLDGQNVSQDPSLVDARWQQQQQQQPAAGGWWPSTVHGQVQSSRWLRL